MPDDRSMVTVTEKLRFFADDIWSIGNDGKTLNLHTGATEMHFEMQEVNQKKIELKKVWMELLK